MRLSWTLSAYLGRRFLGGFVFAGLGLLGIVFLFELIEVLRATANHEGVDFGIGLALSLLDLPLLAQKILPFAMLFGAMFTFARLTRNHELVVARAAGVSVWQFLLPASFLALVIGLFVVGIFNPLSTVAASRHDQMEAKYLHGTASLLALSQGGLWLRQVDAEGQSVIHAESVSQQGLVLNQVIIFLYEGTDKFVGRIDARTATLGRGVWTLDDAVISNLDVPGRFFDSYTVPTSLNLEQIQDSFASPESMSFWALPGFISLLQEAGFAALKHRIHWHSVLSIPLLLVAMVLLAATFSLRLSRRGGTGLLVAGGVMAGFVLFFMTDLALALGLSGKIPPILAAWTPAGVSTLLGLSLLFHLEDG